MNRFNATILSTISAKSYNIYTVSPGVLVKINDTVFVNQSVILESGISSLRNFFLHENIKISIDEIDYLNSSLVRHTRDECMDLFGNAFVSDRDLLLLEPKVSNSPGFITLNKIVDATKIKNCIHSSYSWICGNRYSFNDYIDTNCVPCNVKLNKKKETWHPFRPDQDITHCYSSRTEESCRLEMVSQVAITVVIITFMKILFLILAAFGSNTSPLLTVGDAVDSFITKPDSSITDMEFFQSGEAAYQWAWTSSSKFWMPVRQRKWHALSYKKLAFFLGLYV